jgi:hypothetical protein
MPVTSLDSAILNMAGGANAAVPAAGKAEVLFKAGVLQAPILNCGNFSIIATDETGSEMLPELKTGAEPAASLNRCIMQSATRPDIRSLCKRF